MAVNYLHASALVTLLSFTGLQWWAATMIGRIRSEDRAVDGNVVNLEDTGTVLRLLWGSNVTVALLVNFVLNVYVFAMLCLKSIFFVQLYNSEIRKTVERLVNYVIYKGAFLPLVITPNFFQAALWSTWLIVLSSLKMFQTLAKDRLERLNASPSARYWTYLRVFSVLLFVLFGDLFWIWLCLILYKTPETSMFLLLFLEPLSIASETTQAIMVHGFQLLEMWPRQSIESNSGCFGFHSSCKSVEGSLLEWKGTLIRNLGFLLETMTLTMTLGHYMVIWWLHGMAFHIVDAVLFLNLRALVSAIINRTRGFIKLRKALSSLDVALPDATTEELSAYDDECAICKEPMSRAKKLSCGHLFHLACLRSWLDQGLSEVYSCPTCRRPLFPSTSEETRSNQSREASNTEQHSSPGNLGLDQQGRRGRPQQNDTLPDHQQHSSDGDWSGTGLDGAWFPPWPSSGMDGAGTSAARSVGLGRVQRMMRHLATVSETYAHSSFEDAGWNLWPHQHPAGSSVSGSASLGNIRNTTGIRFRSTASNRSMSEILVMAERVREVLPHIPDELIIEDLQRTNNVTATVNNFLPT